MRPQLHKFAEELIPKGTPLSDDCIDDCNIAVNKVISTAMVNFHAFDEMAVKKQIRAVIMTNVCEICRDSHGTILLRRPNMLADSNGIEFGCNLRVCGCCWEQRSFKKKNCQRLTCPKTNKICIRCDQTVCGRCASDSSTQCGYPNCTALFCGLQDCDGSLDCDRCKAVYCPAHKLVMVRESATCSSCSAVRSCRACDVETIDFKVLHVQFHRSIRKVQGRIRSSSSGGGGGEGGERNQSSWSHILAYMTLTPASTRLQATRQSRLLWNPSTNDSEFADIADTGTLVAHPPHCYMKEEEEEEKKEKSAEEIMSRAAAVARVHSLEAELAHDMYGDYGGGGGGGGGAVSGVPTTLAECVSSGLRVHLYRELFRLCALLRMRTYIEFPAPFIYCNPAYYCCDPKLELELGGGLEGSEAVLVAGAEGWQDEGTFKTTYAFVSASPAAAAAPPAPLVCDRFGVSQPPACVRHRRRPTETFPALGVEEGRGVTLTARQVDRALVLRFLGLPRAEFGRVVEFLPNDSAD